MTGYGLTGRIILKLIFTSLMSSMSLAEIEGHSNWVHEMVLFHMLMRHSSMIVLLVVSEISSIFDLDLRHMKG